MRNEHKTIALFDGHAHAEQAVRYLHRAGTDMACVSIAPAATIASVQDSPAAFVRDSG